VSPVDPGFRGLKQRHNMSTYEFIQTNQTRIQNIDGNLDDGNITIVGENGRLEFYYFEDGVLVGSRVKV